MIDAHQMPCKSMESSRFSLECNLLLKSSNFLVDPNRLMGLLTSSPFSSIAVTPFMLVMVAVVLVATYSKRHYILIVRLCAGRFVLRTRNENAVHRFNIVICMTTKCLSWLLLLCGASPLSRFFFVVVFRRFSIAHWNKQETKERNEFLIFGWISSSPTFSSYPYSHSMSIRIMDIQLMINAIFFSRTQTPHGYTISCFE